MKIKGSHEITEIEVYIRDNKYCVHKECKNYYGLCYLYGRNLKYYDLYNNFKRCPQCLKDFPAEVKDA